MEEHAEAIDLHHVPERKARRLCHDPGGDQAGKRSDEAKSSQQLLALLLIYQGIEHHDGHAENRKHNLGQDANVVGADRKSWIHRPTTLLATCANGVSAACTAGSMMFSQSSGATPITSAATAVGHNASRSRAERSAKVLFSGCVTFPKKTRWYIHSKLQALQITPVAPIVPYQGFAWKAPLSTR